MREEAVTTAPAGAEVMEDRGAASHGLQEALRQFEESGIGENPLASVFEGLDDPPKDEPPKDEDPDLEGASERSKEGWQRLKESKEKHKTEAAELKKRSAELERQIAELRQKTAEIEELREKAKFAEEAEKELSISRVEATREFKETVAKPLDAIEKAMEVIAKSNDVSADRIFDAITKPDPAERRLALKEVTADMDDVDRAEIMQASRDTQVLLAKRAEIFERAAEAAKEAKASEERRQAEEARRAKAEFDGAVESVVGELRKRIPFEPLTEGETVEDVFAKLASKTAESMEQTPHAKAFSIASGLLLPRVKKQLEKANEKIATLEKRIAEGNRRGAKIGDGAQVEATEDPGDFGGDIVASVFAATGAPPPSRDITKLVKF